MVHNNNGTIKFPKGKMYLDKADKWMTDAIFFWWFDNIIEKHIIVSYANIWLKKGIMQNLVVYFNRKLTYCI